MRESATMRFIWCAIEVVWYRKAAYESCAWVRTCHDDEETRSWRRERKRLSSLRVPI